MGTFKIYRLVVALLAAGVLSGVASAQATSVPQSSTLQPEDMLQIQVFNMPQLLTTTPVGKDGYVSAPFVGLLKAKGLTTSQLADEIAKLLKTKLYLRDPIVSVVVTSYREMRATVGGAVLRPGTYIIRPGDTIMTLINQGGGPIVDQSDLRRATLRHAGSNEYVPIDVYSLINRADLSQNYTIQDGDELNIPTEGNNRILILGALQSPGAYPYHEPMTLADSIALAHGEIQGRARFSQTVVFRQKVGQPGQYLKIRADFTRFIHHGDMQQNINLQPGDLVYVPQTNTPDFAQINQIASTAFFLNEFAVAAFGVR